MLVLARMWECEICGYHWVFVEGRMPDQCRNPECRTRRWNRGWNGVVDPALLRRVESKSHGEVNFGQDAHV